MTDLITRVRLLVNDPMPGDTFSDQQIQDELDHYRTFVRFAPLRYDPTFGPGGIVHYWDYFADLSDWEANTVLYDNSYNPIALAPPNGNGTLVSSDYIAGHWTFTDNPFAVPIPMPYGQGPMVRVVGNSYDVYGAAASLLEFEAATFSLEFDFGASQEIFKRSQQSSALLQMARVYRSRARPLNAAMYRSDEAPQHT